MTRTALYRHYDATGALLYVGITQDPAKRFQAHKTQSDWTFDVVTIRIQWFQTRAAALYAEAKAVDADCPRYNYQHSGQKPARFSPPSRPARHPDIIADIEAVCEATGTHKTTFGALCMSDPSLFKNLCDGRELRGPSIAKIRGLIAKLQEVLL